jgi:hypothetical protein
MVQNQVCENRVGWAIEGDQIHSYKENHQSWAIVAKVSDVALLPLISEILDLPLHV